MTEKNRVDLSKIDREDRPYVKTIIKSIVDWQQPPCNMQIKIHRNDDHYNIIFIGWDQAINDILFYKEFLKTDGIDRRDSKYDMIIETETVPVADAEDNDLISGPLKLFRIRRSGFSEGHKRRK